MHDRDYVTKNQAVSILHLIVHTRQSHLVVRMNRSRWDQWSVLKFHIIAQWSRYSSCNLLAVNMIRGSHRLSHHNFWLWQSAIPNGIISHVIIPGKDSVWGCFWLLSAYGHSSSRRISSVLKWLRDLFPHGVQRLWWLCRAIICWQHPVDGSSRVRFERWRMHRSRLPFNIGKWSGSDSFKATFAKEGRKADFPPPWFTVDSAQDIARARHHW